MGVELRALRLLGRCSTTRILTPDLFDFIFLDPCIIFPRLVIICDHLTYASQVAGIIVMVLPDLP
jgi:hypothetical protein